MRITTSRGETHWTFVERASPSLASQSGFNSISSFRRYFVSKVGPTPSAYRKTLGA